MQPTRQKIVELLKEHGQASVEELAEAVGLSSMAVRHHLNVLCGENLVVTSSMRRKKHPGRPQQLYTLDESATDLFSEDYYHLAEYLLDEVKATLGTAGLDELLSRIAARMVAEAPPPDPSQSPEERLDQVVQLMDDKGFTTRWGGDSNDYVIRVLTCPYRQVARVHHEVCRLDKKIIKDMLSVEPVRLTCMAYGDENCTYRINRPAELVTNR